MPPGRRSFGTKGGLVRSAFGHRLVALGSAVGLSVSLGCAVQGPDDGSVAGGAIPRTADGTPDLSGVWQAFTTAAWDLQDHNAEKGVPAGQSIVEGPTIPYQPWAAEQQAENYLNRKTADPLLQCYLPGVPRITYLPYPFEIVQTPELTVVLYEYSHAYRWIWTDGREHPEALEFWMGESRGHWEGDTLVVEVRNHNDRTWFDAAGNFHSNALQVVERYTPIGPNHVEYAATIVDSEVFTEPWSIRFPLYRRLEENVRTLDYECLEYETPFLPWDELPSPDLPPLPGR